jgi:DNA mismatch repair protein MSH6
MLGLPVLHPLAPATFIPEAEWHELLLKQEPLYGSKDSSSNPASVAVGFAFVDAAAGKFYVGTIQDDCSRSALRALLTQVHSLFHCCCIQIRLVMWEVH